MKHPLLILTALFLFFACEDILCNETTDCRGGIEFVFSDSRIVTVNSVKYLNIDILASATGTGAGIGTGIILLNYDTNSFGEFICTNNNVIISKGQLLSSGPIPLYEIIVNDNKSNCLAITFEFVFGTGAGNLLTTNLETLINVRVKILNYGYSAGLSFAQAAMAVQQYHDDNATLFSPVNANDLENSYIPSPPLNLTLTRQNGIVILSWQGEPDNSYNVYSSDSGEDSSWQLVATDITETQWTDSAQESKRFYYVTSQIMREGGPLDP